MKTKTSTSKSHPLQLPATALALLVLLAMVGCNDPKSTNQTSAPNPALAERIVDSPPTEPALTVLAVRKTAVPGDEVTVEGRIAGSNRPFSESFAILTIVDDTLQTCDLTADDGCPTPWDACCEAPEAIAAARLTVQLVGEDGAPLEGSLKGVNEMTELDRITVTGQVSPLSTEENLIIDASLIHLVDHPEESTPSH